jgi:phosphate acetyltransferase
MSDYKISEFLRNKAKKFYPKRILFPEYYDERILKAAEIIEREKIAKCVFVADKKINGFETIIIDEAKDKVAEIYSEIKKVKRDESYKAIENISFFSVSLLMGGYGDGMVSGATLPSGEVLRAVLSMRKIYPGITPVSSCFLMEIPDSAYGSDGIFVFADCALNPDPSPLILANIANSAAKVMRDIIEKDPFVAILSYSTNGSGGTHPSVEKVRKAVSIAKEKFKDILIDGEMQGDAALVEWVGKKKFPDSPVCGKANVLIFPDLNSGNIAYKLVERLCNAKAIGPIVNGLNPPLNDLSRGCSVDDIVDVCAVAVIQTSLVK